MISKEEYTFWVSVEPDLPGADSLEVSPPVTHHVYLTTCSLTNTHTPEKPIICFSVTDSINSQSGRLTPNTGCQATLFKTGRRSTTHLVNSGVGCHGFLKGWFLRFSLKVHNVPYSLL